MIRVVGPNPAIDRTQLLSSVKLDQVNRSTQTEVVAGGKGLGVARAVNKLGLRVAAYGFVGGMNGEFLRQYCNQSGIDDRHTTIPSETRVCNILVEEKNGRITVINEKGPDVLDPSLAEKLMETLTQDSQAGDTVILSGSLPGNLAPVFYAQIIERLRSTSAKIIVDTSGYALEKAVHATPWMIKPNLQEFGDLLGTRFSADDILPVTKAMSGLIKRGISIIIVTLGDKGSITMTEEECFITEAPQVPVVNPTAAGDTFLGGFAVKYSLTENVKDAVRFATACAAANTMHLAPGIPDDVNLLEIEQTIRIHPVRGGGQ